MGGGRMREKVQDNKQEGEFFRKNKEFLGEITFLIIPRGKLGYQIRIQTKGIIE